MAKVYSSVLYDGIPPAATAPPVLLFTPSADTLIVMRDVVCTSPGNWPATESFKARLEDDAGVTLWTLSLPDVQPARDYHWSGRQVFEVGDFCYFFADSDSWQVRVMGYTLTLP